jgi:hypothetical protein
MKEDKIIMSKKEIRRLPIIHRVINQRLSQKGAGKLIGISERQIRRIVRKVEKHGDEGIIHGNRGKESMRKMEKSQEEQIVKLLKEDKYEGFGPTLAAEKFREREKIEVGREKMRQIMQTNGMEYRRHRRNKGKIHQWRERKHNVGEMIQIDGSEHDWLEGRGPKVVFMGYIDDASNEVYGRFYKYEGTYPAMDSFGRYVKEKGLPKSIYIDRHSTYLTTRKPNIEEELKGRYAKTQFGRAIEELEVEIIYAESAEAKGRIERLFDTLQDRMIKEMRLEGIKTMEEANRFVEEYLPKHNARFMKEPIGRDNLHREIPKDIKLDEVFCIKEKRYIGNNYVVEWNNRILLIKNPSITMKNQRVMVMEDFKGGLRIKYKDCYLEYRDVTEQDMEARKKAIITLKKLIRQTGVQGIITPNHPWMQFIRLDKAAYYR